MVLYILELLLLVINNSKERGLLITFNTQYIQAGFDGHVYWAVTHQRTPVCSMLEIDSGTSTIPRYPYIYLASSQQGETTKTGLHIRNSLSSYRVYVHLFGFSWFGN